MKKTINCIRNVLILITNQLSEKKNYVFKQGKTKFNISTIKRVYKGSNVFVRDFSDQNKIFFYLQHEQISRPYIKFDQKSTNSTKHQRGLQICIEYKDFRAVMKLPSVSCDKLTQSLKKIYPNIFLLYGFNFKISNNLSRILEKCPLNKTLYGYLKYK